MLKRRLDREIKARKQAELTLEVKARDLYHANESLQQLNNELEIQVSMRSSALRSSEARYRELVENASDIIFNISLEGKFTFVNKLGALSLGYTQEEIIGSYFIDFIVLSQTKEVSQHYQEVIDKQLEKDYYEFLFRQKDGTPVWVGQSINRVILAEGEVYYSSITRNIDQRKQTEFELEKAKKALSKSEVKYRSIIENMELGLLEVDTEGVITRVYDRFNEMTGYSGDELVGKIAVEALPVPEFQTETQIQTERRKRGEPGVYEIQIRKKDGRKLWVIISGAPFYNEKGEVIGSIGIHYNITERKRLQNELERAKKAAEEAQEAEKLFLASMSHEIRTPLNAILGMSHLLQETELSATQEEYLQIMQSSARILKRLISDVLDMSKIDSGHIVPVYTGVDLSELCSELIKTFSYKNENPAISWEFTFDPNLPNKLRTDPQMLSQVLINLMSNADKFTQKGLVHLNISSKKLNEEMVAVTFELRDTGIGISPDQLPHIFDRFKQANNQISAEFGGTGLGLSISKNLVSLLNGTLEVSSELGKGTCFIFTLDLQVSANDSRPELHPLTAQGVKSIGKDQPILLVEDNEMNVKYATSLLKKWGCSFHVATNGKEALDVFKNQPFSLILMDLQMPTMDGFKTTRAIRNLENGKHIPIVALTASSYMSKIETVLSHGITDLLGKPFTPDALFAKILPYLSVSTTKAEPQIEFVFNSEIDATYLTEAYGGDYSHTLEMMELFIDVIPSGLAKLRSAISSSNFSKIRDEAHRIKPTFTMVGLSSISVLAGKIESFARTKEREQIEEVFQSFEEEIALKTPLVLEEIKRLKSFLTP